MGTYTYAIMQVSQTTYDEIKKKMEAAGYDHVFHSHEDGVVIDMHGIAVQSVENGESINDIMKAIELLKDAGFTVSKVVGG